MEYAYAKKNNLVYATQVNKEGKDVEPTIDNIIAASDASLKSGFPADFKVSITDATGPTSYPICGFTYLLIYEDMSYVKDKTVALQTLQFIEWCETDGQNMAAELGYAKLRQKKPRKKSSKSSKRSSLTAKCCSNNGGI